MLKIKSADRRKYLLKESRDFEILEKVYELEGKLLSLSDKKLVKLIRSQLEKDWRTPLLSFTNQLLKKYKSRNEAGK